MGSEDVMHNIYIMKKIEQINKSEKRKCLCNTF